MKKALIFMAIALAVFVPTIKANAEAYGKVEDWNTTDTRKEGAPTIIGSESSRVIATYSEGTFKIVAANPDVGKITEEAWAGIKITAPMTEDGKNVYNAETLQAAKYRKKINGEYKVSSFWNAQDSAKNTGDTDVHWIGLMGAIDEEKLKTAVKNGTNMVYEWEFDWNGDDNYEQIVTLVIEPEKLIVKEKDTDNQIWNEEKFNEEDAKYIDVTLKATGVPEFDAIQNYVRRIEKGSAPFTTDTLKAYIDDLTSKLKDTGVEFVGFYLDQEGTKSIDLTKELNEDTIVYIKLKKVEPASSTVQDAKNPNTSDKVFTYVILTMIAGVGAMFSINRLKKIT